MLTFFRSKSSMSKYVWMTAGIRPGLHPDMASENTLGQRQAVSVPLALHLLPVILQDFNSSFSSETLHPP